MLIKPPRYKFHLRHSSDGSEFWSRNLGYVRRRAHAIFERVELVLNPRNDWESEVLPKVIHVTPLELVSEKDSESLPLSLLQVLRAKFGPETLEKVINAPFLPSIDWQKFEMFQQNGFCVYSKCARG